MTKKRYYGMTVFLEDEEVEKMLRGELGIVENPHLITKRDEVVGITRKSRMHDRDYQYWPELFGRMKTFEWQQRGKGQKRRHGTYTIYYEKVE